MLKMRLEYIILKLLTIIKYKLVKYILSVIKGRTSKIEVEGLE